MEQVYDITCLVGAGYSVARLSQKEEWALQRRWMEAFIPEVKAQLGKFPPAFEMLGHFESGSVRSDRDARAEFQYAQQTVQEVALLFTENLQPIVCTGPAPPSIELLRMIRDCTGRYLDIAVCPMDCRWTFLITHEEYQYFRMRDPGAAPLWQ